MKEKKILLLLLLLFSTALLKIVEIKNALLSQKEVVIRQSTCWNSCWNNWQQPTGPSLGLLEISEYTDSRNGQEFYDLFLEVKVENQTLKCSLRRSKEIVAVEPYYFTPFQPCFLYLDGQEDELTQEQIEELDSSFGVVINLLNPFEVSSKVIVTKQNGNIETLDNVILLNTEGLK
ncbi:MAG: hypothetical protein ACOX6Q_00705 [Candidatus Dojkabacteria bacterium]|jgi:hypothetical protein